MTVPPEARAGRDRAGGAETHPIRDAIGSAVGRLRADDDMNELLEVHAALGPDAIESVDVDRARASPSIADAVRALVVRRGGDAAPRALVPGVLDRDATVDGAEGELAARFYRPVNAPEPMPVVLYFHGGGWVVGDREAYDGSARGLASHAAAAVVSVDYRRAPEHRFPAAWDDALAAYRWLLANAPGLGADPSRVALAGEGAGGTLAVATAIAARDAGLPPPCHVLAVHPIAQTGRHTVSYLENAMARPLNRAMVGWSVDRLVRTDEDLNDPRLQLVDADLRGLCPVTLVTAELDPLRSDGAKLEDALRDAGVPVVRREYGGVTHEFFGCAAVLEKARQAQAFAGDRLREAFAGAPTGGLSGGV